MNFTDRAPLDVDDLISRIRHEVERRQGRDYRGDSRPNGRLNGAGNGAQPLHTKPKTIPDVTVPELPQLFISQPQDIGARLGEFLRAATEKTEVSRRIPKVLRRLFRK